MNSVNRGKEGKLKGLLKLEEIHLPDYYFHRGGLISKKQCELQNLVCQNKGKGNWST